MHRPAAYLVALGAAGVLATGAFAATMGPNAPARLEAAVAGAVTAALDRPDHRWARARVDGQKVFLSGVAESPASLAAASEAALRALGGGGVLAGGVSKVLTREVDVADRVRAFRLVGERRPGSATLVGHAAGRADRRALEKAAAAMLGEGVRAELALVAGEPPPGWRALALAAIDALARLPAGSVRLEDLHLVVSGEGDDETAAAIAALAARAAPGARVDVRLMPAAAWTARLGADGRLNAEGATVDAARIGAAEFASLLAPAEAAEAATLLRLAAPVLAGFRSASLRVSADGLTIAGEADAAALAALRRAIAPGSAGLAVRYDVRVAGRAEDAGARAEGARPAR